jgi:Adenylate and Guanylate cyclase catalytic domain
MLTTIKSEKLKMSKSNHLASIIEKQNRISTMLVVFVDVEKYSRRRTVNQISVVDALTTCLKTALAEVSKKYITYAQANDLNFETDIIKLPTGDGAAIIFPFEGLHNIHLEFSRLLLQTVKKFNDINVCEKFNANGWCNCHSNFNLTIGVSEGKGIIYTDLNNNYNVAGGVINLAARAMSSADRNQIILTEEAYNQLIEMDENTQLVDKFLTFEVTIKHGLKMQIYQYFDTDVDYINNSPPQDLALQKRSDQVMEMLRGTGIPIPDPKSFEHIDKDAMMNSMEAFAKLLAGSSPEIQAIMPLLGNKI